MKCFSIESAKDFTLKTHKKNYCSDECFRFETNKRIFQKYYEKKAIKNGAPRKCKGCPGFLSRYNTEMYCSKCIKSKRFKDKKYLMGIIDDIG